MGVDAVFFCCCLLLQLHPQCVGRSPFLKSLVLLSLSLVLMLAYALHETGCTRKLAVWRARRRGRRPTDGAGMTPYNLVQVLNMSYTITTVLSVSLLVCYRVPENPLPDPDVPPNSQLAKADVWVLAMNPFQKCFAGSHTLPAVLGMISLVLHVLGWAMYTGVRLKRTSAHQRALWSVRRGGQMGVHKVTFTSGWRYFVGADFYEDRWYFRHINFALVMSIAVALALEPVSLTGLVIGYMIMAPTAVTALVLTIVKKPYRTHKVGSNQAASVGQLSPLPR